jgi:hypothetical protein
MTISKSKKSQATNPQLLAAKARAQLNAIESSLSLSAAFTAEEKQQVIPLLRIPPEAMHIAADLVTRLPDVFGTMDTTAMTDAAAYELAMIPLALQAAQLAASIRESIVAAKAPAAAQALDIYAIAKPLTRLKQGASILPQLAQMKNLVKTTKKARASKGADTSTTETATTATSANEAPAATSTTTKP